MHSEEGRQILAATQFIVRQLLHVRFAIHPAGIGSTSEYTMKPPSQGLHRASRLPLTLRDAAPGEAEELSALALRSKAHWGYSKEFIESCKRELTYRPGQIADEKFDFVVAELDSVVAGFYALEAISPKQYELEALFVEPEHIGKGIGRTLMQHAVNTVAAKSGESVLIQGDPNAEKFYLAAGAKPIGTRESGSIPGRQLPLFEILIQRPADGRRASSLR